MFFLRLNSEINILVILKRSRNIYIGISEIWSFLRFSGIFLIVCACNIYVTFDGGFDHF